MNLQEPFLPYWVCGATSYVELPVLGLPLVCSEEVGTESIALRVAMRCPSPGKKLCQEKLFLQGSCQRDFYSPSCCGKGEVLDMPCLCLSVAAITGVVCHWGGLPCLQVAYIALLTCWQLLGAMLSWCATPFSLLQSSGTVHVLLSPHACLSPRIFCGKIAELR